MGRLLRLLPPRGHKGHDAVRLARELGRRVPEYRPFLVARDVSAVSGALELVAAGEAVAAVAEARAVVLEHYTVAAFEGRWRDLLARIGVCGGHLG